ncbi:hypothetical protein OROHE_019738 [Orobanche hederae]
MSAPEHSSTAGISEEVMCKNRLQEYAQRASLPLPIYQTSTEGPPHTPVFRSQVWVDGQCFISPNVFLNKKMAEQDAAKHALIAIREKVKNEGPSRILEDKVFCKSMVNEFAVRMNRSAPTYTTNMTEAFLPMFVSSLQFDGVTYTGQAGKTKKEAEQFAACAAVLSILGSESSSTMSEIVKSKFKLYDALKKVKDSPNVVQGGNVPGTTNPVQESGALLSVDEKKEAQDDENTVAGPCAGIPQSGPLAQFVPSPVIQKVVPEATIKQASNTQAQSESVHVFKKPKLQASPSASAPPTEAVVPAPSIATVPCIEFVPPASEEAPTCSIPGKRQSRRRKKGKKKAQNESPLVGAMIPQSPAPAFSLAQ